MEGECIVRIKCNLSTLMGTKRFSIQDVHEKTGLSRGTISSLYNDRATRIDYETIAKLCSLFRCDVGGLLSYCSCDENEQEGGE